jgi:hypothetical protein
MSVGEDDKRPEVKGRGEVEGEEKPLCVVL